MIAFRKHTCIRFRLRKQTDMYYLSIYHNYNEGCYGDVGRQTSVYYRTSEGKFKTRMNMHSICLNGPNMIHKLMHTIGFHHEHQRVDRDPRFSNSPRDPDSR
ncbi:unnamed protein product [Cylicocyclus nassatus]|uniref:Peptidase M12A domain-containing protein n=1 Tax=Cylicocyclus nassatus TaxID=53992 RepID=A0AA36M8A7_CYLNA|nr:unnamed protein product [Cylicocyclus nassatus]